MSPDTRVDAPRGSETGYRPSPPATSALQERYRSYRLRQGRDLLGLIPREGLRQVIQACRPAGAGDLSLDELAAFCADLMPLPSLTVWMVDFQRNRAAHLADEAPAEAGPRSPDGTPVAVAVRHFRYRGRDWVAQLQVQPLEDRWEGAIHFHGDDDDRAWRTAPIFREATVAAIRERFQIFDDATVAAFLRSALP